MAWRAAGSLLTLRDQVNAAIPKRAKNLDGLIANKRHHDANPNSDHEPWVKDCGVGVVTAMDITHDPKRGFDSYKFANYLLQIRDPRIKYIISNGRISSGSGQAHPAWQWRSYKGSNKHDHHIHISVKSTKDLYDSTKPWDLEVFFNKAKPSPVQPVEPLIVTRSDSTEANREHMGQLILDFEARRDKKGHLAIYPLPRNDRGGFYEVAGINDGYHPEEAAELAKLIHAGRYNDAEKRAREIIIEYTNPVAGWYQHPAVEFFLRDTAFNRGPGAPRTLKRNAREIAGLPEQAEEVMPKFEVRDIGLPGPASGSSWSVPGRLRNDFVIETYETDPADKATDSEAAYISKLKDTLTMLKDAERQDTHFFGSSVHQARTDHRETEVCELRKIATEFADGRIDADAAASATTEVAQKYAQNCPDLVAQDKAAAELRFAGDFTITKNYAPDGPVKEYIDRIADILDRLAEDEVAAKTAGDSVARLDARQGYRKEAANSLRKEFEEFRRGSVAVRIAADHALVSQGIYIGKRDQLKARLFNVIPKYKDEPKRVVELEFKVTPGLPPPDDQPSQEKQDLFVQVGNADTVISTVSRHMDDRAEKIEKRWWYGPKQRRKRRAEAERQLAQRLLDDYLRKLAGIAVVGLEGPHTTLAKLALNELRSEFTAQQAGRIKNIYVRGLGATAATAAVPLLLLYAFIAKVVGSGWWYDHRAFLIAAAGAAIGTWLSFSIRRVSLSFSDLGILEEDLLDPSVRIIFVIALTLTACLLFWTGVMNIQIGDLKTNAAEFMQRGSIAMLLGVFFGISERALATAISGRATAFVRSVGGG